ncbi:MAG: hypothetical protein GXN98_01840 [Euryarchaeota archaeon]|nr:hypothetical protein [Euryarchaeota archaeon]
MADFRLFLLALAAALLLAYLASERWSGELDARTASAGVFLLLLTLHTMPELNPDAARYFSEAKFLAVEGVESFVSEWGKRLYVYVDQPLVPFIYGILFKLFGESRLVIQAYNFTLYALLTLLVYRIAQRLWGRRAGSYTALLMLASPYVLSRVPLTLVDVSLSFLTAALAYSLLAGLSHSNSTRHLLTAGACVALIPFTKLTGGVYLLPLVLVPLTLHLRGESLSPRHLMLPVLLGTALALPVLLHLAPVLKEQIATAMILKSRMPEITGAESVWNLLFYQFSAPVTLLAASGAFMALRRRDWGIALPLLWFLVPLVIYHDTRIRYMIPAYPALALLAGYALARLSEQRKSLACFLAIATVLSSLMLLYLAYVPFAQTNSAADLMRAAKYAERIPVESVDVYAVYPASYNSSLALLIPLFDLHSSKEVLVRGESLMPTKEITPEQRNVSWTWSFELPGYYFKLAPPSELVAVISPMYYTYLPPLLAERLRNYTLVRTFEAGSYGALFPYKIRLYLRNPTVSFGDLPAVLRRGEVLNITWHPAYPFPQDLSYRVYVYSESQKVKLSLGEVRNTSLLWRVPLLPPADDYRVRVYASWNGWQTYGWNDSRRMRVLL